ncbi:hypothetical protein B0H10DRAFT_2035750 [Mycena sp. CBHHK59/15]|nr:hypothetical protein B0H10DRAFT_2035750 [Mycena sp. CBHHK59/15]
MNTFACFFVALITVLVAEVRADCAGASQAVPLYRDWNSAISDHFYTTDLAEYNSANAGGYTPEGIRSLVFSTQVAGSVQFIRLWNGNTGVGDHFYTTNATEAQAATGGGYVIENKATMYIYPTQLCGSVPLYRLYSQGGTDHFYTISATERDGAAAGEWTYEWIAGYVFAPPANASSVTSASLPVAHKSTTTSTSSSASASTSAVAAAGTPSAADVPTGPVTVLPAPTTMLGGSLADSLPSSSATAGSSAAIRVRLGPGSCFVSLLALVAALL